MIPVLADAASAMLGNAAMFIAFELLLFLVSALFIKIGAGMADVRKRSLARSFLIAILAALLVPLLLLPFAGFEIISLIVSFLLNLAIIKLVFQTKWRKALITWTFSVIAALIAILMLLFVLSVLL